MTEMGDIARSIDRETAVAIEGQRGQMATVVVLAGLAATSAVAMAAQALVDEADPVWLRLAVAAMAVASIVLAYLTVDSTDGRAVDPARHLRDAVENRSSIVDFERRLREARLTAYLQNLACIADAEGRLAVCAAVSFLAVCGSVWLLLT